MIKAVVFDLHGVLFYRDISGKTVFIQENIELLHRLSLNYKIGGLSNAGPSYREILKERNLLPLFEELVLSSEVGLSKPEARIFHLLLRKMNLQPEEAVFIDDTEENALSAEAVGMKSIFYQNSRDLKEKLTNYGVLF